MSEIGLSPMQFNVIVEPEVTESKTAGGIILIDSEKDKNDLAATRGTLVAVSPVAFTYASETEWAQSRKPQVGDIVLFKRYAGITIERDGRKLRIMKDDEIWAVEG